MLLKFVYVFCMIFIELHDVIVCGLMRCLTCEVWLDFYDCTLDNVKSEYYNALFRTKSPQVSSDGTLV